MLVNDLLELSHVTRAPLARIEAGLSRLAGLAAEELRKAEPKRKVSFDIAADVVARGDEKLLRIVFDNLMGNAWKFTAKQKRARIAFGARETDEGTVYFVRDNGAGFDAAYADKLFLPFQRLHSADEFPGTGIGLATVRRIVNRHDGRIWAEGTPGKGACFYFTLAS